jgi:hypothetical protein
MELRTRQHLERAERNRAIANALLSFPQSMGLDPPPLEWAVVVAFYAAVHFVNAFLWEHRRWKPPDHNASSSAVNRDAQLRSASPSYERLRSHAYQARYLQQYHVTATDAGGLVHNDLESVRRVVLRGLGMSP